MGAPLPALIKVCLSAMETSQFTFNQKFKVMFTVFWDPQGILLAHFQKRGENVISVEALGCNSLKTSRPDGKKATVSS
jgi:hypothetical protein